VRAIDFSPDGAALASGSEDSLEPPGTGENTIKLWRVPDGAVLSTVTNHTEPPVKLSLALHGTNLVLSWPQTCADYVLEESVSLRPLATWEAVQAPGTSVAVLPIGEARRFYRLRKGP
jgi:WD40 repeat protein